MNDSMTRAKAALAPFSIAQRFVGVVMVIALLMGGFVFYRWAAAPSYVPLFSGLSGTDASAITEKLSAAGVAYELPDAGTILVPKDQVYAQRVAMSGQGLPASSDSTGYGLLDKQGVTASQFQQETTYQRALEGELSKSIGSIDGISASVIRLAIPKKNVFIDGDSAPTASVLVKLRPGRTLNQQQVQSIVHLVASSVQDLSPDQITVSDDKANLLAAPGLQAGGVGGLGNNDQVTADYENAKAAKLQTLLDKVVGPGRAVARVSAELQFDQIDTVTERVTTDPKAKPIAESESTEKYSGGAGPATSGVLGTDNIAVPNPATTTGAGAGGDYEKRVVTRNNAQSKVTEKKSAAQGGLVKQQVSVVVDTKATGANLAKLQTAVATAAGVDTARGDVLSVTSMPFDATSAEEVAAEIKAAEEAAEQATMIGYATQGLKVLGVILVLLFVAISRRKRRKVKGQNEMLRLDLVEQHANAPVAAPMRELAPVAAPAALTTTVVPPQRRRDDVLALVERQPDEVAELLRGWLADRRG
ncbi:MAG TPA: flagellar basal-body MS-ring/collar protein FliF [Actinomycetales bacterium]|jgi:flagellar M-ring protein FliF